MKVLEFNKERWYRFENLCKLFGFKVETGSTYTYSNLVETEHCFLRVIKNGNVCCIANLIDEKTYVSQNKHSQLFCSTIRITKS